MLLSRPGGSQCRRVLLSLLVAALCCPHAVVGEGDAQGEGEGEGEEEASAADIGISVMLLGGVSFMMALFELTHCYRQNLARYTWKSISATISIFSSVLIFQGFNGILEAYLLEGASGATKLVVGGLHLLAWFVGLQVDLAIITGVLPIAGFDPKLDDMDVMKARLKTFAILLGHITGFAAINFFATAQQLVSPRTAFHVFLVSPAAWATIYFMCRISDMVRERVVLIGDGKKEKNERLWDEHAEETEDDVVGLATSFVFTQAMRLAIGGHLPNAEGEEPRSAMMQHTLGDATMLIGLGWFLVLGELARLMYIKARFERLTPQLKNIIAMNFSWCVYFGTDWFCARTVFAKEEGMTRQVTLALIVTVWAMLMLFLLEHLHDLRKGHLQETIEQAIHVIVNATGILIGFAWEKAFDIAVVSVTDSVSVPPQWAKLALSVTLATLVVPAWYRHILPTIIGIETDSEEEGEEGEGAAEEGAAEKSGKAVPRAKSKGHAPVDDMLRPLLDQEAEEREALREQCKALEKQVASLEADAERARAVEREAAELEAALGAISGELLGLQQLADKLSH